MKEKKDSIRNKEIWALVLIILLFILIRAALLYIGAWLGETRENELIQLKLSALTDIVTDANRQRAAAAEHVSEHIDLNRRLLDAMQEATGAALPEPEGMSESEYEAFLDRCSADIYEVLKAADESFGGVTLVVNETEGKLTLLRQFGSFEGAEELPVTDLAEKAIRQPEDRLTVNGREYQCGVTKIGENTGSGSQYVIQIIPLVSVREQNVSRALLVVLVMVIIFAAVTVYVTSAQRRLEEKDLTEEEKARYHPDSLKKRMITVGILSVVVVFAAAVLVESVGQMVMELRYGRDTLRLFAGQVEKESRDRLGAVSREEEAWVLRYGEEMAGLIAEYPELAAPEKLQEYCDILDIDYIMLFDGKGNESACSRDYVGFTLGDGPEDEMYDFRRLLHGVPGIVHETSTDTRTGLERQMIGVKLPAFEQGSMHGALVMALLPGRTDGAMLPEKDAGTQQAQTRSDDGSALSGTLCFSADAATGEILYAQNASMLGKTITECGLPENSLQDGYMDFTAIGGTDVLVLTVREGDRVSYYAAESGTMFGRVLLYGVLAALLFALVLALLLVFLLRGDSEKARVELSEIRAERPREAGEKAGGKNAPAPAAESAAEGEKEGKGGLADSLRELLRWDRKTPGQRARFVLHIGLVILILCCLDVLQGKGLSNDSYDTMLGFLLHGDWMRGFNLLSLCSCLLIIAIAYLVNIVSSLLLKLTGILFSGHGETVCRLLYSCVKYITVIGVIYFCLEYLGFPTGTILAALASVSLAISLGAQDLIADILAGLAIVFDGSFRVGDVVEIGGRKGVVLELGVRATRIRVPINNILVINNHEIKDILNLSKENSECAVKIRVYAKEPLGRIEEAVNRALPAIGEKDSRILYGPYLIGVTALPDDGSIFGPSVTLSVGALCDEKDEEDLKCFLNRELKLLAEEEGIELV